ncbi:hypothetical protein ACIG0C_15285 [Kitasatospora aureofaciens]|uniref:Uncharacterized protein n=1 Tax=Kitasatospora aureofaciens TaxID=1894 RepID=A0A1E7N9E5_KITAU|nr:hypothetical protein [Kitasatospora aureofaciens]OEV37315.1 hypothetical protein HS99_0005875 [Kitasatospora aureofaciens]GGU95273.1 hypothetical protein GCM10010502_56340 [Kitasatospora aureofaciens]
MEFDDPAVMRRLCGERLGPEAGPQFAAMARRGFRLAAASEKTPATGRSQLGGSALLEPGTPWPVLADVPLSLHAVLDTGTLYFTIPARAFAAGDFSKAEATGQCC